MSAAQTLEGRDGLHRDRLVSWLFVTFLGELVFMVWLLYRGWRIPEPAPGT